MSSDNPFNANRKRFAELVNAAGYGLVVGFMSGRRDVGRHQRRHFAQGTKRRGQRAGGALGARLVARSALVQNAVDGIEAARGRAMKVGGERDALLMRGRRRRRLAIDIGGSHIKCTILNSAGEGQIKYRKLVTPNVATPANVITTIQQLVKDLPDYDKVSVGFPGYVRNGIVFTAPNLWDARNIELGQQISNALRKPVRLVNDADQLGLGVVSGQGFEMAVTLGTGVGTAILFNGYLLPHLELAHHPIRRKLDWDSYIGERAMRKAGRKKWNRRVVRMLAAWKTVFNYDRLYLGGGGVAHLCIPLDENIHLFSNEDGIKGGARLWQLEEGYHITTNYPK